MASEKSLKGKVLSGLFWQYFQRIGSQTVSFMVSIILARLLVPSDFGAVALLGVFITICNIFIDSGFGNALIQRKTIDELDASSVFYTNLAVAALLYTGLFFLAPVIAKFYEMQILTALLRVLSLQLFTMSLSCVQNALLVREMKFKINFFVNLSSVLVSSVVGITCAYRGFGVWSLVYSQLSMQIVAVLGYWILVGWRPRMMYSFSRIRSLFGYGSRILAGSLLHVVYNNVYNLVIGKRYSATELGYYNRGYIIPTLLVDNAANTINGVMFPALSKIQDDKEQFRSVVRNMVSVVAFIVFLLVALLIPLSYDIISLLLTDRWLPSVPFMQIVSVTVCFTPFILINSAILTALGESKKYLKGILFSRLLAIAIIVTASFVNVYVMVASGIFAAILSVFIMSHWNNMLIGYSRSMFLNDFLPSMILAIVSGSILYLFTCIGLSRIMTICTGGCLGAFVYIGCAYLLRFKQIIFIKNIIRHRR